MLSGPRVPILATRLKVSGGYIGGVPPVPIPNTEVKPSRADGTARFPCGRVGRCRNFYQNAPPSALYEPTAGRSLFVLRSLAAALRYDGAARGGVRGPGLRPSRARGAWVLRATLVARHCERRKPGTTTPPRVLPRDRAGHRYATASVASRSSRAPLRHRECCLAIEPAAGRSVSGPAGLACWSRLLVSPAGLACLSRRGRIEKLRCWRRCAAGAVALLAPLRFVRAHPSADGSAISPSRGRTCACPP